MKKSLKIIALILVGTLCLTGCKAMQQLENFKDLVYGDSNGTTNPEEDANKVLVDHTIMQDLEEVVEEILSGISAEQSNGYPLDENFFAWFYGNYGEEILRQVAVHVATEESNDFWNTLTGNTLHALWVYYCADTGMYPETLMNVYAKDANGSDIIIDFIGDLNFDDDWPNIQDLSGLGMDATDRMNDALLSELTGADILMVNNEFTYGEGGTPLEGKAYTFQAHPDKVKWLTNIGTDIVSLANNHVFDYGPEGLMSTIEAVESEGLPFVGAGENLDEAKKIVYFVINGKKIAFTAATQIERTLNYTKEATETTPGVLKTLNADKYVEVLKEARKNADFVIAYVHWGTEGSIYYGYDQRNLADRFIEAGVDVIIGGHTHCLQGFEYRNGVPVFYSLGNFWFDWEEENSKATGVAQLVIHPDGSFDCRFIPCVYDEYATYKLTVDSDIKAAYEYMESISNKVSLDDEGYWIKENENE